MPLTADDRWRLQERAREALNSARRSRYPVVLLLGLGERLDADLWREFAQANGLAFLDMVERAQEAEFQQQAGAWPTLVDWLRAQARAHGGVFVMDLDAVVTRWTDAERRRCYLKLLKSEPRTQPGGEAAPIVAVSRLALEYGLPDDRREYGIVVDLLS